jgi:hypothetical protein
MSSLTNNAPFSLNAINLRKELVFPDGSIQSTAYTGDIGVPNLEDVLTAGADAGGLIITNVNINTTGDLGCDVGYITTINFDDGSLQTSAPRFLTSQGITVDFPLTSGVSHNIATYSNLPVGVYALSGYLQNVATVADATSVQVEMIFTNGTNTYPCGWSGLSTQTTTQTVPYFPIATIFRNTVAGSSFTLSQSSIFFGGGVYTQTQCSTDLFYIGAL